MSFVDSLLKHSPKKLSILLVDKRAAPGGHWNDAYGFVTLHQPARNYGVESSKLEAATAHPELLASRDEVLAYYKTVLEGWQAAGHDVRFVGGASFDFEAGAYTAADATTAVAAGTVVDARYTENDLPLHTPPKFAFDASKIDVVPPNELPARAAAADKRPRYCVVGAGKTGQDAMLYLREKMGVAVESLAWVVPTDPWITARDPPAPQRQITCMEFLAAALDAHAAAGAPAGAADDAAFLQRGFASLEAAGKVYRLDGAAAPTKFMDATLNGREVGVLKACAPSVVRRGRLASIDGSGALTFADGSTFELPWDDAAATTTFVHCTAGAFDFGASAAEAKRPIWSADGKRITVQEIFQFPGFCFNGAVIAWLECQHALAPDEKNARCEQPPPGGGDAAAAPTPSGLLGALGRGHPLLVSLRNLRRWYDTPGMGEWLHGLRLFSLTMNGYTLDEGKALIAKVHDGLVAAGIEEK